MANFIEWLNGLAEENRAKEKMIALKNIEKIRLYCDSQEWRDFEVAVASV